MHPAHLLWHDIVLLCTHHVDRDLHAAVPWVQLTWTLALADTVDEVQVGGVIHVAWRPIIHCEDVVAVELHNMVVLTPAPFLLAGWQASRNAWHSQNVCQRQD